MCAGKGEASFTTRRLRLCGYVMGNASSRKRRVNRRTIIGSSGELLKCVGCGLGNLGLANIYEALKIQKKVPSCSAANCDII